MVDWLIDGLVNWRMVSPLGRTIPLCACLGRPVDTGPRPNKKQGNASINAQVLVYCLPLVFFFLGTYVVLIDVEARRASRCRTVNMYKEIRSRAQTAILQH